MPGPAPRCMAALALPSSHPGETQRAVLCKASVRWAQVWPSDEVFLVGSVRVGEEPRQPLRRKPTRITRADPIDQGRPCGRLPGGRAEAVVEERGRAPEVSPTTRRIERDLAAQRVQQRHFDGASRTRTGDLLGAITTKGRTLRQLTLVQPILRELRSVEFAQFGSTVGSTAVGMSRQGRHSKGSAVCTGPAHAAVTSGGVRRACSCERKQRLHWRAYRRSLGELLHQPYPRVCGFGKSAEFRLDVEARTVPLCTSTSRPRCMASQTERERDLRGTVAALALAAPALGVMGHAKPLWR